MSPSIWRRLDRRDRRSLAALATDGFVALDLETTGLDPRRDAVVALAAVPFVGGAPGEGLVTLIDPGRPIPAASTAIHGITDAMVAGAPRVGDLLARVAALCQDAVLAGHGVAFDLALVGRACRAAGRPPLAGPALCTLRLAAALHPAWGDLSLEGLATRLGVPVSGRHTADGDARMAGRLLLALLPALEDRGLRTVADAQWLQDSVLPRR